MVQHSLFCHRHNKQLTLTLQALFPVEGLMLIQSKWLLQVTQSVGEAAINLYNQGQVFSFVGILKDVIFSCILLINSMFRAPLRASIVTVYQWLKMA